EVMALMGHLAGLAVHSNGWDEITLDGPTHVVEVFKGKLKSYTWTHRNFGLPSVPSKHLKGSDAASNAQAIKTIIDGGNHPARNVVLANAAALIWIAARAYDGDRLSLKDAVERAVQSINSGAAREKYRRLVETSTMLEP
ncbi:MAG: anthranilate phosphoribosyltransferase, partial [Elusimicrobia bacterium]|nr:anthranilate phosphoribosyltransferase [Elusimicrobiota bacterium]